jgi:hypothetical protein
MGLKSGWLALFLFVWIIGAFLGSTFEYHVDTATGSAEQIAAAGAQAGQWAGDAGGGYEQSPITTLDYILNFSNSFQRLPFFDVTIPIPSNMDYWEAVYKVVTWRWSFMEDAAMVYWIFCAPFVAMGMLALLAFVFQLLSSIVNALSWT